MPTYKFFFFFFLLEAFSFFILDQFELVYWVDEGWERRFWTAKSIICTAI